MDDDRTTVMARGDASPFSGDGYGSSGRSSQRSHRSDRQPINRITTTTVTVEERFHGSDGVGQIEEQTSFGQVIPRGYARLSPTPHVFGRAPKLLGAGCATPARPSPAKAPRPTPRSAPSPIPVPVSRSTPPPIPSYASQAPRSVSPPVPSSVAPAATRKADFASEPPTAPVFVRDAVPSSPILPRVATRPRPRRSPMLILSIGIGTLGMIFTLGIVCGSTGSFRRPIMHGIAVDRVNPPPSVAAASPLKPEAPPVASPPLQSSALAAAPATTKDDKGFTVADMTWKETAAKDAKAIKDPSPSKDPLPVKHHHSREKSVTASADHASDPPRPASTKVASAPDPDSKKAAPAPKDDMDAAKEANDLARAQLEASFK